MLVQIYRQKYKLYAVNGILFNHDSKKRKGFLIDTIISYCLRNKRNNKKLVLQNSYPIRDYGHADDITEAMTKIMSLNKPDDYIISGGTVRSVKEITFEIFKIFNIKKDRVIFLNKKKDIRLEDVKIGNTDRIKKATEWKPNYQNKKLIQKLVDESLDNA